MAMNRQSTDLLVMLGVTSAVLIAVLFAMARETVTGGPPSYSPTRR